MRKLAVAIVHELGLLAIFGFIFFSACDSGDAKNKKGAIMPEKKTYAIFETSLGDIEVLLYPDKAPKTVENFIGLAGGTKEWADPRNLEKVKRPLYNGTLFHRVIPNFMIQGGDPKGNGTGGPGYRFEDEFVKELTFSRPGILAMANSGPNTNGSQFFITEVPTTHLDGRHTIFGEVTKGLEIVKAITRVPRDSRDRPLEDVILKKVKIIERD